MSKSSVQFLGAGYNPHAPFQPGDFLLLHEPDFVSKMIRVGQRVRYNKDYAYWNHTVLITSRNGDMIEALKGGVTFGHISKYQDVDYYLVRVNASKEDALEIVAFANSILARPPKYGFGVILSIFFTLLFGWRLVFGRVGTYICSGLVASALTRGTAIFDKPPEYMTPADLAKYYNVNPHKRP